MQRQKRRNLRLTTVWRICNKARLADAFDGRGAAEYPGRWNNAGVAVVYTAESRSLASLEVLVHAEDTRLLAAVQWVTQVSAALGASVAAGAYAAPTFTNTCT
jgi:RES domain-containing protein